MTDYNKLKTQYFLNCVDGALKESQADGILGKNAVVSSNHDEVQINASQRSLRFGPNSEVDEKISIQKGGSVSHAFINNDESNSPTLWNQSKSLRDKFKSCHMPKIF